MTYLQLINDVLIRLRENEVSTVSQTTYAKMIGKFINDIKREVEDSYDWNSLTDTLTATTSSSLFNYVLTGSGVRFRILNVLNDTSDWFLENPTGSWMTDRFLFGTPESGSPKYYSFNGVDANGDTQVDLYPIPNGAYNIRFNIIKPQAALSSASDVLKVPSEPVLFGAYAKALAERGEDMGQNSSEAYALYRKSLADHIAIEASRYPNETLWNLV
jgi:hypothetical protein